MRIRSFTAASITEAMRQVRESLGPDAIIVSTHRSHRGRGVHITAALEAPDLEQNLRRALAEDPDAGGPSPTAPEPDDVLSEILSYHGVPERQAQRLLRAARELPAADDPAERLAGALDHYIAFEPLSEATARAILLVGPPGAGKTTVTAKQVTRLVMNGHAVCPATTDTVRAGGVAQLEAFTRLLQQPLHTFESPGELTRAMLELPEDRPLYIDTPGTNPFAESELEDLRHFIAAAGEDAEPVLVLGAGGDPEEATECAQAFRRLGCRRLVLTRMDSARRFGAMVAIAIGAGFALSDVSISASVPQGLKRLNPMSLARVLTRDPVTAGVSAGAWSF